MKILTLGEIVVEIVAQTKGNGFLEIQPLMGPFPSGAPAIFIDQIAKLGSKCAIISRVGNDDFGSLNLDRLSQDGVDVSGISVINERPTGSAFVRYNDKGERKFVFNITHSACGQIERNTEVDKLIDECSHLHIMGSAFASKGLRDLAFYALRTMKKRGASISFDPNLRKEMMLQPSLVSDLTSVLSMTDTFLPSGDELFLFTESKTVQRAVDELLDKGIKEIVLKNGAHGARYFSSEQQYVSPALTVVERDPTGAGDTFGGAFIALSKQGMDVEQALFWANVAGARAVEHIGPMEGTSTLTELKAFLEQKKI